MDWACESLIHRVSCGIGVSPLLRPSGKSCPSTSLLDLFSCWRRPCRCVGLGVRTSCIAAAGCNAPVAATGSSGGDAGGFAGGTAGGAAAGAHEAPEVTAAPTTPPLRPHGPFDDEEWARRQALQRAAERSATAALGPLQRWMVAEMRLRQDQHEEIERLETAPAAGHHQARGPRQPERQIDRADARAQAAAGWPGLRGGPASPATKSCGIFRAGKRAGRPRNNLRFQGYTMSTAALARGSGAAH